MPAEILICPWAGQKTQKGLITCGADTEALLEANNKTAKRFPRVALDFEHNTVPGSKSYRGEPAKVAAWGDLDVRPGEGIFLSALDWTPEGEEHVRNGHAKGISPAAKLNDKGEVIFIHSAGLCRHQEIDGLTLFAASDDLKDLINTANQNTTHDMDTQAVKALCNVFLGSAGLPLIPDAATVEDMQRLAGEGADKIKAAMNKGGDETKTFSADIKVLKESIETLKKDNVKLQKERLLDGAIRDGKVIAFTAEQIDAMEVATFSAHITALPAGQVPMEKHTPDGAKTFSADGGSNGFTEVHRRMGLTKGDLEKYGPKN